MAVNGASITIVGNATRDPELRFTNSGMAVAEFSVAVNFRKMNRSSGEWEEEEPSFFRVACFGEMGENVAESIAKGSRVIVVGRLKIRKWEADGGKSGTSVDIVADEVAPSLRWATADVHKADRRDGDGGDSGSRGGNRSESGDSSASSYSDDEEPF